MLWQEAVDPVAAGLRSPTVDTLPTDVDVVVVGGGYCGLEAAATLADLGRSVVLLDRHDLGWGASSRNGGMSIPELKAGPTTLQARYGPLGARLHAEVEAAFDHVESLVGPGGIDCDYERTGQLYLTHGRRGAAALAVLAEELRSVDSPARVVSGDELRNEAGSELFVAGVVIDRTGGLHPAKFHEGLVARARAAGAALFPQTAALSIEPAAAGAGHDVRTPRGSVRAGAVLLATNAYAEGVSPALRRRVLPMESFIIATEPMAPELAATVLPTRRMAVNDRNLLWYWRHGPDGRLLFGGRKRLGEVTLPEARDHLYRSMVGVHPQLAGTRVDRVWGGRVALTLDRMPHCGRTGGVWYATGCNGSGVALNTWMGRRMAEAICGDELPPFAELQHRRIPLHRQRRAWLPAVGAWFRLEDARDP